MWGELDQELSQPDSCFRFPFLKEIFLPFFFLKGIFFIEGFWYIRHSLPRTHRVVLTPVGDFASLYSVSFIAWPSCAWALSVRPMLPELYLHLLKIFSRDAVLNSQQCFLDSPFLSSPFSHTLDAPEFLLADPPKHIWTIRCSEVSMSPALLTCMLLSFLFIAWIFLSDGKSLRTNARGSNSSCFLPSSLEECDFLFYPCLPRFLSRASWFCITNAGS